MAWVVKRNNSYKISASCGYDMNGKQIIRSTTYKPSEGMTEKQIQKEVERQKHLFEESCKSGLTIGGNTRFAEFTEIWLSDRKKDLRPKTYARYVSMIPRINAAIGNLKLSQIQPTHLRSFYSNLSEGGIRNDTTYICIIDLKEFLQTQKLSKAELSRRSGVSVTTITTIIKGGKALKETAEKLSRSLNLPFEKVFEADTPNKTLSDKTVLNHHRLISSILKTAVEWGAILLNPCDRTKPPKAKSQDPKYLDDKQALILIDLLQNEPITYKTFITLLLFTGMRRGEALGLKWSDVDFDTANLSITRSLQYLPERGIFEDETKNKSSERVIKLPATAYECLREYRMYKLNLQIRMGDAWKNSEGYIFTSDEGKPLHPDTVSGWFSKFVKKHNDEIPYISIHSLRHTNATLQIAANVPITTVAKRLGHASSVTTGKIYAHAIMSADEAAANELENMLNRNSKKQIG